MTDPAAEDLLGYLLEALDEPEQAKVEERLGQDPRLREELASLRGWVAPLATARRDYDPPPGLAARTCRLVAERAESAETESADHGAGVAVFRGRTAASLTAPPHALSGAMPAPAGPVPPARVGYWRWQDMAVAAAVFVAVGSLVFPAIHSSRFRAQVTACQNNLHELGLALTRYSQRHGGYFPPVPAKGRLAVAGIYAPTLLSGGFLADDRRVLCPASPLGGEGRFTVPALDALQSCAEDELARLLPELGGSYGYCLGYTEEGEYHPTRNLGRATFAVVADAPSLVREDHQSDNHGGLGENVWFEDGHVRFVSSPKPSDLPDHIYLNERGLIAAGAHSNDSVVAPSAFRAMGDGQADSGW